MNPIKLNQSVLTTVGVCAAEKGIGSSQKKRNLFIHGLLCVMTAINSTTTTLYFVTFMSTDYEGAIYALLAATAVISQLFILINLRIYSERLRMIFSVVSEIKEKCELDKRSN